MPDIAGEGVPFRKKEDVYGTFTDIDDLPVGRYGI